MTEAQTAGIILGIVAASLTILGALFGGLPWVWRRLRRQAEPTAVIRQDVAELKQTVHELASQLSTYLDGLPQAKGEVRDPSEKGLRLQHAEEHEAAIAEFEKALAAAEDDSQRCALHSLIGNSLRNLGRPAEAEGHYRQAVDAAQKAQDKDGEAFALGNLGTTYADLGEPDRAQEHYERSLAAFEKVGDRAMQATVLNDLGLLYVDRGEHHNAKRVIERALALQPLEPGYQDVAAASYVGLGLVSELLNEPEQALRLYVEALQTSAGIEDMPPWAPIVAARIERLRRPPNETRPKPKRKRPRKKPPPKPC